MTVPPLAVSMGDPAGIGLEIAAKAYATRAADLPCFALIADPDAVARAAPSVRIRTIAQIAEAHEAYPQGLPVLPIALTRAETPGRPDSANAPAIIGAIERGAALALSGEASALVTLPIAKAVLHEAGFGFPGHTEFVAHLTQSAPFDGPRGPVMMLAGPRLRVALATIHMPLMRVAEALTPQTIAHVAAVTADALRRDFGIAAPRIAIAALNPHAGEGGAFGDEEARLIAPAIAALRAQGIAVTGPHSADALFHEEARGSYDAAIALYHDQGLIPVKTLDFWTTVNATIGLPIIRTSPDHGVAYDRAGMGTARPDSLIAALVMAAEMAAARRAGA